MSCYSGPEITNSNLVLSYDPANLKSYNQAENLYPNSESLSISTIRLSRITTSSVSNGGPLNNAYVICTVSVADGGNCYLYDNNISINAGDTVTQSWYVKDVDALDNFSLYFWTGTGRAWTTFRIVNFTLSTKTSTVSSGTILNNTIENVGNGWYRLSITAVADQTGAALMSLYVTNIQTIGKKFYVSGPQLTKKNGPTTYTPTTGSSIVGATTVSDITGNGIAGTLMNAPIYNSAGYFKYTYTSSHYINVPANSNYNFLGIAPYTLEAWIYPTRNPGAANYTGIFDRESNPGSGRDGYNLYFLGSAGTTTTITSERWCTGVGTSTWITLDQSISVNNWHHIVATYDGSLLRIYRNGAFVAASGSSTGSITNTTKNLTIGLRGTYFDGNIGATNIYKTALSATEVLQNFNARRSMYGL